MNRSLNTLVGFFVTFRHRLFTLCLLLALICTWVLHSVGPALSSESLIILSQQYEDTNSALNAALRERELNGANDEALTAVLAAIDERRQKVAALPISSWYWLKFIRRGGDPIQRFGTALMHFIVAVALSGLFFVACIWWRGMLPGVGRGPKVEHLLPNRILQLASVFAKTDNIQTVQTENSTLSDFQQADALTTIMPIRWTEWALPILGFIGTVVGIAGAVEPLQTGISILFIEGLSPRVLNAFNSGFAGLSVSFDTTFLGLFGLAIVGSLGLLLRRTAMIAIGEVDRRAHEATEEMTPRDPWEFRDWIVEEFPKRLEELRDEQLEAIKKMLDDMLNELTSFLGDEAGTTRKEMEQNTGVISRAVTSYGEISARLAAHQNQHIRGILNHQRFLIQCVYEAASQSSDDFWVSFVEAIERPFNDQSEMTMVVPGNGSPVQALTTSSSPYRVAYAYLDGETNQSVIKVVPLDDLAGTEVEFYPQGIADLAAAVTHLAFDPHADTIAYALNDGTVGIYDVNRKEIGSAEMITGDVHPGCFVWSSDNQPVLLVGITDVAGNTAITGFRWRRGARANVIPISIEGDFEIETLTLDGVTNRFYLAGTENGDRVVCPVTFDAGLGRLKITRRISFAGTRGASIGHAILSDAPLRIMSVNLDATIHIADATESKPLPLGGGQALACAVDLTRHFVALAQENSRELILADLPNLDNIRQVRGFGEIARAAVTPNAMILVVAGIDGHIAYWQFPQYLVESSVADTDLASTENPH